MMEWPLPKVDETEVMKCNVSATGHADLRQRNDATMAGASFWSGKG